MSQPTTTSEARPAKRQRVDDGEEESTRSDVWHDDGSVVLRAQRTLFRVHWTVLCLHSSVFRDLRGIPQPPEQPQIEGCPVVELHDDPQDIEHFLTALYNPHLLSSAKLELLFLASIVRIGRKYDVQNLLKPVLQRLANENPTTLEKYDASTSVKGNSIIYVATQISHHGSLVFAMVELARSNGLLTLLPCAYLRVLLSCSVESILDGRRSKNGTKHTLSFADQRICILARQKFREAQWTHPGFTTWLRSDSAAPGCVDVERCIRRKKHIYESLVKFGEILGPFFQIRESGLCVVCLPHHLQVMKSTRESIWQVLPTFFGLPPWDELKDDL